MERLICIAVAGLWIATVVQDLTRREVSLFVLTSLVAVSLPGHRWFWWALASLALLWPWQQRHALLLAPIAVVVGAITGEPVPALALAVGGVGWALHWWGGADGIVLLALALRHGQEGMLVGIVVAVALGIVLTVARRRSLLGFLDAMAGILTRRALDEEIPLESEIPAAAALAAGGLAMEVNWLWTTMFG